MKAGSLDNYLLNTSQAKIHSKFGLYLRSLINQKQKDADNFTLHYIPGTSKGSSNKKK